jgi:hypothetical protein
VCLFYVLGRVASFQKSWTSVVISLSLKLWRLRMKTVELGTAENLYSKSEPVNLRTQCEGRWVNRGVSIALGLEMWIVRCLSI